MSSRFSTSRSSWKPSTSSLANTQYYGWAYVNRDQLCRAASSSKRAEEVVNRFRERVGNAMKIYFVVP
jgi:pyrroloquinoline quinone biosynthesis protein E